MEVLQNVTSAESSHCTSSSSGLIFCDLLAGEENRVIVLSEIQASCSSGSGVDAAVLSVGGLQGK